MVTIFTPKSYPKPPYVRWNCYQHKYQSRARNKRLEDPISQEFRFNRKIGTNQQTCGLPFSSGDAASRALASTLLLRRPKALATIFTAVIRNFMEYLANIFLRCVWINFTFMENEESVEDPFDPPQKTGSWDARFLPPSKVCVYLLYLVLWRCK